MAKEPTLQELEIQQLDLLKEIDGLQRGLALLYLDKKYASMKPLIPQLTRRWEEFHRLILKTEALIESNKVGKASKLAPFDYSRIEYDYR